MQDDLIKWYKNFIEFSAQEKKLLNAVKPEVIIEKSDADYLLIQNAFFDRMPFCNINTVNRYITFDKSGTDFINKIFETEINDETLVISSIHEHESVKKWLKIIKNVILLDLNDDYTQSIDKILFEARKYKKVFVYIIGTKNATGEITPQEFFVQLKQKFEKNNIFYTLVLDDVQGMFLVPRDYSIFDYIIGTAHALCPGYDMGIMLSKYFEFGKKAYNWGEEYLKHLDIMLKRRNKINIFKTVMLSYYKKHLNIDNKLANPLSVPYIFYFTIKDLNFTQKTTDLLHKFNLLIPAYDFSPITFVHMRCHEFIYNKSLLPHTISILNFILENKAVLNEKTLNSYIENELIKINLF